MKIRFVYIFAYLFSTISMVSCQKANNAVQKDTSEIMDCSSNIKQGINGKLFWSEGNLMPGPGIPQASGKGIKREMLIYELTSLKQVKKEGYFFKDISQKLIAQTSSDNNGCFSMELEPGEYSIFSKEDGGLYANEFDGQGNIFKVEVKKNQVTDIVFRINYKARY